MFTGQNSFLVALTLVGLSLLPGCGGTALDNSRDAGDDDNQSVGGKGSAGGSSSTGGQSFGGAAGGGAVCCLAMPVCSEGEYQVANEAACPSGAECRPHTMCCSTIWCAKSNAQCTAVPVCDSGDTEVQGSCPPSTSCYERSLCGATIVCKSAQNKKCDPTTEYNKHYVATDPQQCMVIDFACPANTAMFGNECGCGCEQDSSCPRYVDCMPGPMVPNPLCSSTDQCPYTLRAM